MSRLIAAISIALVTSTTANYCEEESAFKNAEFTYSTEPGAVVLFVNISADSWSESHSATLYGDGRLELQVKHAGTTEILEKYQVYITNQEVQALLERAVNHGLTEWDGASVHRRILRATDSQPYAGSSDMPRVTVLLSLTSYSRGEYSQRNLERIIKVNDASHAAALFPDIIELQELANLQLWAMTAINRAQTEHE